jgi:hypothetical protein
MSIQTAFNYTSNQSAIKMSTQLQTVEIRMNKTTNVIFTMKKFPICPVELDKYEPISLDAFNGDYYCWYPDGSASVLSKSGTYSFFWPKPTIADAVNNKFGLYGSYMRFHKTGSVELKLDNHVYWWGPTVTGKPVEGILEVCRLCKSPACHDFNCTYTDDYEVCDLCHERGCYHDCLYPDGCDTCQSKNCSGGCRDY